MARGNRLQHFSPALRDTYLLVPPPPGWAVSPIREISRKGRAVMVSVRG